MAVLLTFLFKVPDVLLWNDKCHGMTSASDSANMRRKPRSYCENSCGDCPDDAAMETMNMWQCKAETWMGHLL
eukprot:2396254-Amphidinium_carterae.1